ncbi:MAG TPA: FAD-binding oxidoreductase [Solirubrobacterales bacterium]|nr:FAD-binding oxidoreductase [Solirubrobacterales bacterium]
MTEFNELSIAGRVATPSDPDWDEARAAWNLAADQRPVAVALVESADDVAAVVSFAAEHDLRVAGQSTGHGAVPLPPLDETVLIKTERMRGIEIDPEERGARVEAGVLSIELAEAAAAHGLASLPGSSPDVGVAGYTLGGGLSWFGRLHGFACNQVKAIELVTAEGERRTVDANDDPDLFWALRGGGGGYAIVTALHLTLLPISEVYGGIMILPAELGAGAFRAYRDWAAGAPDEVTSIVRLLRPPPIPDVPEPLRGVPLITIDAAFVGDREQGEALIAPLREIGEPLMDSFDAMPAAGLGRIHMDPEQPVPGLGTHAPISELPDEAIDAFVANGPGPETGSTLLLAELRQLGGALGRHTEGSGALEKLDFPFVMSAIGSLMAPGSEETVPRDLDRIVAAMEPWTAAGGYFNFAERPCDVDSILPAETCARLAEVKRRYDPGNRIVANHAVALDPAS